MECILTQKAMAKLFEVKIPAVSKHLANICETGELEQNATLSILETVQMEGQWVVSRKLEFYSLDAIIAVGYRVNSYQATQFRIWATMTLKEFIIKGFVLNDERLRQGKTAAEIIKIRPQWHHDDLRKGVIKVVMTSASSGRPGNFKALHNKRATEGFG